MWRRHFEHRTDLRREQIWPILTDVQRWPDLDHNIERVAIGAPPAVGVPFTLKPKGGPTLSFVIGDFTPPGVWSDVCVLPGARMRTLHELVDDAGTVMRVTVEITGALAWFWGWAVGRTHVAGLPAQTDRILAAARAAART